MNSKSYNPNLVENAKLEIYTLGQFVIKRGDRLISEDNNRSHKLWELFKYLITYRDKGCRIDNIQDILWSEKDYIDPKHALQTLVFRLRQRLNQGNTSSIEDCNIVFSNGSYFLKPSQDCWIDAEEFVILYEKASQLSNSNPEQAAKIYKEAAELYKGEYLPQSSFDDWVIPIRNYYRRMYMQLILELTKLLKSLGRSIEVIGIYEKALLVEPLEEEFHLKFIEALLSEGLVKEAKKHYEYATSLIFVELGTKPSYDMKNLYRQMSIEKDGVDLDLNSVQDGLRYKAMIEEASLCDQDIFRFLYRIEMRRAERAGQSGFIAMLTITKADFKIPSGPVLKDAMECLKYHITSSLRKGDVISQWNDAQFLVILPGSDMEQLENVIKRIHNKFHNCCSQDGNIVLRSKLQPISPK